MSEETAAALAREFDALNKACDRAHALIADLKAERQLMAEERRRAAATAQDLRAAAAEFDGYAPASAERLILEAVAPKIEEMNDAITEQMRHCVAKVNAEIDGWLKIALGTDDDSKAAGKLSIPEIVAKRRSTPVTTFGKPL